MNAIESKQPENYELIKGLKNLMNRCEDARVGYQTAKELVDENELSRFFEAKSLERARFRNQLKNDILILGGESEEANTSIMAEAHRTWMSLRASFGKNDTEAVLQECIRGEKELLEAYDYCIENKSILEEVYHAIISSRNVLKNTIHKLESMVNQEELVS